MAKKWITVVLSLALAAGILSGCGKREEIVREDVTVRVGALKGPTAMGMVKLMADEEAKGENSAYEFSIMASPDEVTPLLIQGDLDIAAVPANLASVLYNKTGGKIKVLAINTLGVLYLVENGEEIESVADLEGRTIYASGKGATPEYVLNYLLTGAGLEPGKNVTIEWKTEHSECAAALLSAKDGAAAMLPQPFATTVQMKNPQIRIALDLTEEWDKTQEGEKKPSALVTGVVVTRADFLSNHPEAVASYMDAYRESVEYVNGNPEEASQLIEKYGIVPADVALKALPYCGLTFIEGEEMRGKLSGYLNVLLSQNPQAVGGAAPGEEFYYAR